MGSCPFARILNFYGGSGSRVRWHSDNEGLFGKQEESKLIVSLSFGVSALFKWKPGPSLDSDASSSWLHHGDLLVMDGCCQDEYLHFSDEYYLSVDQEPRSSVSFGYWGRVLPANMRKGFTRLPARSRSCRVCSQLFCWFCWLGGFSF